MFAQHFQHLLNLYLTWQRHSKHVLILKKDTLQDSYNELQELRRDYNLITKIECFKMYTTFILLLAVLKYNAALTASASTNSQSSSEEILAIFWQLINSTVILTPKELHHILRTLTHLLTNFQYHTILCTKLHFTCTPPIREYLSNMTFL